ncbi:response regulator transcription factor [Enterococcus sp. LJL99]
MRRYKEYSVEDLKNGAEDKIEFGGISLNINNHKVTIDGESIEITPKEFAILSLLLSKRGIVLKSEDIFYSVWGEKYYDCANNTIMSHIRHLRQKMKNRRGY